MSLIAVLKKKCYLLCQHNNGWLHCTLMLSRVGWYITAIPSIISKIYMCLCIIEHWHMYQSLHIFGVPALNKNSKLRFSKQYLHCFYYIKYITANLSSLYTSRFSNKPMYEYSWKYSCENSLCIRWLDECHLKVLHFACF